MSNCYLSLLPKPKAGLSESWNRREDASIIKTFPEAEIYREYHDFVFLLTFNLLQVPLID
jgi:hypothetical protein